MSSTVTSQQTIHDYRVMQMLNQQHEQPVPTTTVLHITYKIVKILLTFVFAVGFSVFEKVLIPIIWFSGKMLTKAVILLATAVVQYVWKKIKTIPRRKRSFFRRLDRNIISPYDDALVDGFEDLAENLEPSEQYLREGRRAAQSVFEKLQMGLCNYDVKIGKTKIAGSFGKGTGISFKREDGNMRNPDLDLVVFVNDVDPPFAEVYQIFKKILETMDEIKNKEVRVKKYSMQFTISTPTQGDIKVDLLASTNRTKNTAEFSGSRCPIGDVQAELEMADLTRKQIMAIKRTQNIHQGLNKLFSSAFAEKTVDIIRNYATDRFTQKVIMLAKYWNARLELDGLIPARSCMIEVIAIHTQLKKLGRGRNRERCVVSGFRRFLRAVATLDILDISLDEMNNNIDLGGLQVFYSTPMVRDPVNWFNNLAHGLDRSVLTVLVSQAKKILNLLDKLKKEGVDYESVENAIDEIFCRKGRQKISHR